MRSNWARIKERSGVKRAASMVDLQRAAKPLVTVVHGTRRDSFCTNNVQTPLDHSFLLLFLFRAPDTLRQSGCDRKQKKMCEKKKALLYVRYRHGSASFKHTAPSSRSTIGCDKTKQKARKKTRPRLGGAGPVAGQGRESRSKGHHAVTRQRATHVPGIDYI